MGFKPDPETIEIDVPVAICPVEDGSEPLHITVRTTMTGHEMEAMRHKAADMSEVYQRWAPFIVGWNLEGVEPPATGGWKQLHTLPAGVDGWIVGTVSQRVVQALQERAAMRKAQTPQMITNVVTQSRKNGAAC